MPIIPIETAVMAPKSQDASMVRHQQVQKPQNDQMHIQQQFNSEIKHNNQQTVKMQKSDNHEYRYDAKEKGNGSYSGSMKKKGEKDKKENKKSKQSTWTGSIDIRI